MSKVDIMWSELLECSICSQKCSWERINPDDPPECEHCTECDSIVCEDCFCWATADEATNLCKDCCGCYITEDGLHFRFWELV